MLLDEERLIEVLNLKFVLVLYFFVGNCWGCVKKEVCVLGCGWLRLRVVIGDVFGNSFLDNCLSWGS